MPAGTITAEKIDSFIEDGGQRCPFCHSDQLEGNGFDMFEGFKSVQQEVSCKNCDHQWVNYYRLTGMTDID